MDLKSQKATETASGVPTDGPQTPKNGENVVWGAGGWTANAKKRRKRRLRCQQMDRKRQKEAKPSLGVLADGPQTPKNDENVVWGAGGWTANAKKRRKRRLGCQRMDLKRQKKAEPSSGVLAGGPQTPKKGENVVWGARGWTANAKKRRKRRLGCRRMDRKRQKTAKPSSGVLADGPQETEWQAKWRTEVPEDGGARGRRCLDVNSRR